MAQVADEAKSGLDPLFDPGFFLDDEQKELRQQLIEICEREIRPLADANDRRQIRNYASLSVDGRRKGRSQKEYAEAIMN